MIRRKTKGLFWLLGSVLALEAIVVMANYGALPAQIPLFMDLSGRVLMSAAKGWFTSIRLPLMGLAAFALCWLGYRASLKAANFIRNDKLNKGLAAFWTTLAITLTLKASLETLSMFYVDGNQLMQIGEALRIGMLGVVGAGLVLAGYEVQKIYTNHQNFLKVLSKKIEKREQFTFAAMALAYLFLVVAPRFI